MIPGVVLRDELGRGASSVVYRGARGSLPCAVKVGRADAQTARWFRREAAALARVTDAGLPTVLDVGEVDGVPYLVMELVEGETLSARLARGPLPEPEAIELARTLATTLHAVHRRGLVHRDVKPRNIVLEAGGAVRLVDLGFAAPARGAHDAAGTRAYAAPEQLGAPAVVDGRADLYALGRVLYECVTGVRWPGSPDDAERAPSEGLRTVLASLIAANPQERYRAGAGLAEDLARLLRGEPPIGPSCDGGDLEPLPFVAREPELRLLFHAFAEARRGWGGALLVRGPRGSGKSRLLRELCRAIEAAPEAARLLVARCEQGDPAPVATLRSVLASLAESLEPDDVARMRQAVGADLLAFAAAISPELARALGIDSVAPRVGADAFGELAAELLGRAALELGPLLIAIDDAQWIDPISADVVSRLIDRARRLPVLVLGAGRSGDGPASFFGGRDKVHAISLSPFDEHSASELATAYLGAAPDAALVAWIVRVSDGTPLGIGDVLGAMLDAGVLRPRDGRWRFDRDLADRMHLPRGALALLERRIAELSEPTARTLRAAALVGRSFHPAPLAPAFEAGPDGLTFAIVEARAAGMIETTDGGECRFVHDCVREALVSGLSSEERRAHHQRIAEAMDAAGGFDAYALATHYASGETERDLERVLSACRAATSRALEAFDHEATLRFFELARSAAARAGGEIGIDLLLDAGEAALRLGAHAEAIERFEAALPAAEDDTRRATILARIAWAYQMQPDPEAAWRTLARAFAELDERMPVEDAASAGGTALALLDARIGLLHDHRDPALIELLCELHYQNLRLGQENGRPLRLLQSALRGRALAAHLGPSVARARTEGLYGLVLTVLGGGGRGRPHLELAKRMAAEIGNPPIEAYCTQLMAVAACFEGDFDRALEHTGELLGEQRHWLETYELCWNVFNAYWIEAVRGRPREAWAWLELAITRVARQGREPAGFEGVAYAARATLAMTSPSHDEADARRALRVRYDFDAPLTGVARTATWGARARWLVERGDVGPAFEALVEEYRREGIAPRSAHPIVAEYYVAVVHGRIHQCLRALPHERARAAKRLAEATADLKAVARSDLLRAHLRLAEGVGAWLRGSSRAARTKLDEADELACDQSCPWVRFGVERARAHLLREEGRAAASLERARSALYVARTTGAVSWARWIEEELGVRLRDAAPAVQLSAVSRSGSMSTSRGQLHALLSVLRAGSRLLPMQELAQSLVAEVLAATDTDRGFLLFEPEEGAAATMVGRSKDGAEWPSASPRARALLDAAQKSGVVALPEDEGDRAPRAAAVPLWLRERGTGALFVERDPDRAGLAPGDLDVLVALSYQVPLALELARALRDREQLEDALRHAQKMEAVGRLAGGITHDFNNMLHVMVSCLQLLDERAVADPSLREEVAVMHEVVDRARGLTRQLLSFARRQSRQRERHDLARVFEEIGTMLRRLIPVRIAVRTSIAPSPLPARIDRGLFEQAIVNLAVNARDAIAERGTISLEVSRVELDEHDVLARPRLSPGPHVCIVVADDGAGMSREVRENAFEPFFTTKGRSEGTGLGLAMVHGFVQQSDGSIELESELGRGTRFRIFLPIVEEPAELPAPEAATPERAPEPPPSAPTSGASTILVVEDEALIRTNIERILSQRGYRVLGARAPQEALALAREAHIDLLISDVLMPGMSGPELAQAVLASSPDTKLLFISGYADGRLPEMLEGEPVPFLQKPFGSDEIGEMVRTLLAR